MDIQIKINDKEIVIDKMSKTLFEISEYTTTKFCYDDKKENSYIMLETYNEENKKILKNEVIYLNESLNKISKYESTLISDIYPLIYFDGEKEHKYNYYVKPSVISVEDLGIIKSTLEKYSKGFSLDMLSLKKGVVSEQEVNLEAIETLIFLLEQESKLRAVLTNIYHNPILVLKKEYEKSDYLKNYDMKICKHLQKNNINIYSEKRKSVFLSKETQRTIECKENIWLHYSLKKILIFLNNCKVKLKKEQLYNCRELEKNKIEQEKIYFAVKTLEKKMNGSIHELKMNQIRLLNLKSDILRQKILVDKVNKYIIDIERLNALIVDFIRKMGFFKMKKQNFLNLKILKNPNYSYINLLLKQNMKKNNFKKNKISFEYKKTYELYECYVFILMNSILKQNGFILNLNDHKISFMKNIIRANEEYEFEKNQEFKIVISYDKEINNFENKEKGFICSNTHNKPDFLLSIYKNQTLIKSMIIEVKCSKSKNIYNKRFKTKVTEQIESYNFYHYKDYTDGKKRYDKDIIEKVIVIYPSQKDLINHDIIQFINIKPSENIIESEGYETLSKEIINFIELNSK